MAKKGWVVCGVILLCIVLFFVMLSQNKVEGFVDPAPTLTAVVSTIPGIIPPTGYGIYDFVADSSGNLYISYGVVIRKVTSDGTVTTIAGGGTTGTESGGTNGIDTRDGIGTSARFSLVNGITIDSAGNLYVSDFRSHKISRITTDGTVTTIAGGGLNGATSGHQDGIGTAALFFRPSKLTIDSVGNLFVVDFQNNKIRKITPNGTVSTFAGGGTTGTQRITFGTPPTNGPGNVALFELPTYITIDSADNLYVLESQRIRKITSDGTVTTFSSPGYIQGLTVDLSGNFYTTLHGQHKIYRFNSFDKTLRAFAGDITAANMFGTTDGIGTTARFNNPTLLKIDSADNLYVLESTSQSPRIRKITMTNMCPANYYYKTEGSKCTALPDKSTVTTKGDGYTCDAGYYNDGAACVRNPTDCPPGKYLMNSRCLDCSPSTYQPKPNFTGDSCINKPTSNVESSTATSVTCQTGHTLSSDGTECTVNPCGTGTYSQTGSYPCTNCPQFSSCSPIGFSCQPGYTKTGFSCQPNPCEIGKYSITGSSPCTACRTGYSTASTGSTTLTNCKITLQISDILKILNYSLTNPSAKYYGLTPANLNITGPQTFTQGTDPNYESYIIPPSLVTASAINSVNGTSYHYTNPQGRPVNNLGQLLIVITDLPPYTEGSPQGFAEAVFCSGITPASCTITYNSPGGIVTTNPCLVTNSWYNFDKGYCVNKGGTEVTTLIPCGTTSIYNREVNSCIPVQPPYFKPQPPNTTGTVEEGDFDNCLTVNGGDCRPIYTIGTNKGLTNPCPSSRPIYNFATHACETSSQSQTASCCSMGISNAAKTQVCLPFVKIGKSKNSAKCPPGSRDLCCNQASSTNSTCEKRGYWQNTPSYKTGVCPTSGFIDIGQDTMQTKRIKWAQNRKLLNAP